MGLWELASSLLNNYWWKSLCKIQAEMFWMRWCFKVLLTSRYLKNDTRNQWNPLFQLISRSKWEKTFSILVSQHRKLYNKHHNECLNCKVKDKILYVPTICTEMRDCHVGKLQADFSYCRTTFCIMLVVRGWDRWWPSCKWTVCYL